MQNEISEEITQQIPEEILVEKPLGIADEIIG